MGNNQKKLYHSIENSIMKPYLLKGHERPLTFIKYNQEGNILLSCGKDNHVTLWFSDCGSRAGIYRGHVGAVNHCDITSDSKRLITASADSTLRIWEVCKGTELFNFRFKEPCRAITLSLGDELAVVSTDFFLGDLCKIHILRIPSYEIDQDKKDLITLKVDYGRITRLIFHDVNRQLITTHEDGSIRRWDVETGKHLQREQLHERSINDIKSNIDGSLFITASSDKTSKLVDPESFQTLNIYQTECPVNSADLSPIFEHVLVGGGQDAALVTTTTALAGKFESIFFNKIFAERFAAVKGHFGPINSVAFHPDGRSFSTGGEDGYVRLHKFDKEYFRENF